MSEPMNNDDKQAEELVDMIETLMANGSGHLTISEDDLENGGVSVKTYRSMDCSKGNMACCQPTELMDET